MGGEGGGGGDGSRRILPVFLPSPPTSNTGDRGSVAVPRRQLRRDSRAGVCVHVHRIEVNAAPASTEARTNAKRLVVSDRTTMQD